MNFVDHVNLVAPGAGGVHRVLEQLGHLIDAAVGGGIHFDGVDVAPRFNAGACGTFSTGPRRDAGFAIDRARQDARDRGLANPPGAGKQIGMVQATAGQCMRKRTHHVLLSDQRFKVSWPPLPGKHLMGHGRVNSGCRGCGATIEESLTRPRGRLS